MKAVAIDLGSNTFQILFADIRIPNNQIVSASLETFPYLLKRKLEEGTLVLDELENFLKSLRQRALSYNPECLKAVATAVWRQYPQLAEVLNRAIPEARIISGKEEASLTLKAIKALIKPDAFSAIDLGGGSIEIINSHHSEYELVSINAGTAELLRLFPYNKYTTYKELENDVVAFLESKYPSHNLHEHIIGVGGAFHTIANLVLIHFGQSDKPIFSDYSPFPLKRDVPIEAIKEYINYWEDKSPLKIVDSQFHKDVVPSFRLWQLPYIFAVMQWLLKDKKGRFTASNAEIKFGLILNCIT